MSKQKFIQALHERSLDQMQNIPKSDLHSHAGRGGTISYIEQWTNVKITPPGEPFASLGEMNRWLNDHVKIHCPGVSGYLKRVEAAFAQAKHDHIKILAMSYGADEIDSLGTMDDFAAVMNGLRECFAPDMDFYPDLALGNAQDVAAEQSRLDELFAAGWFKGIDICNYSNHYTFQELKSICRKARASGLTLKAHIGEFGGPDEVMRYAEELALDEIQHGVSAADSPQIMRWLARNCIQLNVCPTSNVMLKNSEGYASHQIRKLFDFGVPVTINTDDLMIFNATVSQEYLNLFNAGLMAAEELNLIRETGLKYHPLAKQPGTSADVPFGEPT